MKKYTIPLFLLFVFTITIFFVSIQSKNNTPDITRQAGEHPQSALAAKLKLPSKDKYVGARSCAGCHQQQFEVWQGSHHQLAMQHANDKTVLGDFNNRTFNYHGITSTFRREADRFFVSTDGPDGKITEYEIKYTFGIEPLQQYLVEIPNGRMQALSIAWDSRPTEQGGQRWFHLYPDENIDHKDELHWTRISQNWNYMCAECHSTNLKKNYTLAENRFNTNWSEINVSCEACHGPASRHIDWSNKQAGWELMQNKGLSISLDERKDVFWQFAENSSTANRNKPRNTTKEIDTCARCHARRSTLTEKYEHGKPLMDTHLPALLTEQLYHLDGQIKEEVYVYGSFQQSKMFHQGVTCSDCHEPHSLTFRTPGNETCLQCHQAAKYNSEQHHFHKLDKKGASCAECHMPASNFMVIDARHDHSIRIPRPDLTLTLNTPNACNQCHTDKSPEWANTQMETWYGKDWSPGWHFGETLYEAREGRPHTGQDLVAVAASPQLPEIARATAIILLPNYLNRLTLTALPTLLTDKSDPIRYAALRTVDSLEPGQRWQLAGKLLTDGVLAVRIEAARVLSVVPRNTLTSQQQQRLDHAVKEYIEVQMTNAEHPQSHVNLGLLYQRQQQYQQAQRAYSQALKLDPGYAAAYVNLADLYRQQQEQGKVETTLLKAKKMLESNADVEHALGLHYVRSQQPEQALVALARAAQLQPDNTRYSYVYAVALYSQGQTKLALATLKNLHDLQPYNVDVLIALASYSQALGDMLSAVKYAEKLVTLNPAFGNAQKLLQQLSSQ